MTENQVTPRRFHRGQRTTAIGFMAELYLWNYTLDLNNPPATDLYRQAALIRKFGPA